MMTFCAQLGQKVFSNFGPLNARATGDPPLKQPRYSASTCNLTGPGDGTGATSNVPRLSTLKVHELPWI